MPRNSNFEASINQKPFSTLLVLTIVIVPALLHIVGSSERKVELNVWLMANIDSCRPI
ncbi:hypothetical protein BDV38DRAFT_248797 [Aspergillus pseudotamarii]|uniref:Uncharacterized protein n=1 Tax=Aspergillus pseudotamarii TaxID=132259 RepID=A0A5N6ST17_ASPPS|nr:uncharacterized protein BDV38DRAFT_248797 [Aspergillus pseudotamarii]KAE8136931.1 hypothetical protein BDV38DRAFT_248797 [Aspergillus pseudotamarii]